MDNLDFENDKKILLEVLTVLEPGIFENEKRLRLLDIVKESLKVLKSVKNLPDDWETEKLETGQYTMILFLEKLKEIQNDKIKKTMNYFWRIFDAKIYDQAIQKLKCPEIQDLYSSIGKIYGAFFDLCNLCSWNETKIEDTLQNFRNLVLQRNWDSVLVKDKLYGEPEEIFVKKFAAFVNEIREMPMTDIAGEIDKFKNCEVHFILFYFISSGFSSLSIFMGDHLLICFFGYVFLS